MKLKRIALIGVPLLLAGAVTAHFASLAHEREASGQPGLAFVSCDYCHGPGLADQPWAKPRPHHDEPGAIVVSPDGTTLYIALYDKDEVAEADVEAQVVTQRVKVAGGPFGLALNAQGNRLFVACRRDDRVVVLDTSDFQELGHVQVGIRPTGVVYCRTPAGARLIVPNSGSNDISVLSVSPLRELSRPAAGREPYAAALSADGRRVYVANRMADPGRFTQPPASEVTVLDPANGHVLNREELPSALMAEGIAAVPGRNWMISSMMKVRNLVPTVQVADGWITSSGLAVSQPGGKVTEIPLDNANAYFADPSGVAVGPGGHRAYVAAGGADVVSVVNLDRLGAWLAKADAAARRDAIDNLALSYRYVVARIPTAANPRQLALSPDGRTLFVAERMAERILLVNTSSLRPEGQIVLGDKGPDDPIFRGERVFDDARYAFQGQFSCRSCHPGGGTDGLTYDFDVDGLGRNLVDNRTLCGVANTAPFDWGGNNPSLSTQDGPGFARVLTRTDQIPPKQVSDLVTFIRHLPPTRTIPWSRVGKPLTPAEERGRELFFATRLPDGTPIPVALQCQTCHRPPLFTDRLSTSVGTKAATDSSGVFDTPGLLGVAASAPYLHDGRARTLEEIWTTYQKNNQHGVSSHWTKEQLNDLVKYLKTL